MKDICDSLPDFVATFDKLQLRYALMGGMAVRAYSIPRATWDLDLLVALNRELFPDFLAAVAEKGYAVP